MRFSIVNASPRGKAGNTARIIRALSEGLALGGIEEVSVVCLADIGSDEASRDLVRDSDVFLLAFPLYVYSLPAQAIAFMSALASLRGSLAGKTFAFLCQYGFNEACHARECERSLEALCATLGVAYGGTLIRGGSEGLARRPPAARAAFLARFRDMGRHFAENACRFDEARLKAFCAPESADEGWGGHLFNHIFAHAANWIFWRPLLRKNGALGREKDRPLIGLKHK